MGALIFIIIPWKAHSEEISMSAYDALQGMFLQIGAQALLSDLKNDRNATSHNSEKIEQIEQDVAEIKDILRFLAREISVKEGSAPEGFKNLEKNVFLMQNALRIQEIKENARHLKKSLYEVKQQTPSEKEPTIVQKEGYAIEQFRPTTFILTEDASLYANPYGVENQEEWLQEQRFTAFERHGNRLKISGKITQNGWQQINQNLWIEERFVKTYSSGASQTLARDASNPRAAAKVMQEFVSVDEEQLRSSIFQVEGLAEIKSAPNEPSVLETWEEGKMFTAQQQRSGWIQISGYFVQGHWTETEQPMWIASGNLKKVK